MAPRQVQQPKMKDSGLLGKLPPEVRRMIYELVLADSELVQLEAYQPRSDQQYVIDGVKFSCPARLEAAPYMHKRDSKHRGQEYKGRKWVQISSKNALLQANKQILAESSAVLYGYNTFEFQTTRALEAFVIQIGEANRRFVRTINLIRPETKGWGYSANKGLLAQARAMKLLTEATNIRTISVDCLPDLIKNIIFLPNDETDQEALQLHVKACLPVLQTLHEYFTKSGINANILDVLQIKPAIEDRPFHLRKEDCDPHDRFCQWCDEDRVRLARARAALKLSVIDGLQVPSLLAQSQQFVADLKSNGGSLHGKLRERFEDD